jgi:8-oxo-dGTP diphosphatase
MSKGLPTVLVSAVALIDRDGRVLLAQRPAGKRMAGLWEFPGGKIETGESCLAPLTFASHSYDDFHLLMLVYVCRKWTGTPRPLEGGELAWVRASRLRHYEMPPADIPLIPVLQDLLM